jgi:hypothetical protein
LALLILTVKRHDAGPSRYNLFFALFAAQVALYYKETAFLLIGCFACVRLVVARPANKRIDMAWLKTRTLELGLLGLVAAFLGQFAIALLAAKASRYQAQANVGRARAALDYFASDPVLLAFIAAVVLRLVRLRRGDKVDLIWDLLALGGLVYFAALVTMGLSADRYVAPVDLIGALFCAREVHTWVRHRANGMVVAAGAGVLAVAGIVFGATRLIAYKSIMWGTTELAGFVERFAETHTGNLRLFFPTAEPWRILNMQAYLRYRNEQLFQRMQFLAPYAFSDGQCVFYYSYRCPRSAAPGPGDLVVQLPDDAERINLAHTRKVFEYRLPSHGMPGVLGWLIHREAPLYAGRTMQDGWLSATVALASR